MSERNLREPFERKEYSVLPDLLTPPTFTQELHSWWGDAPATTRVTAVLLGVLATSVFISTLGIAATKIGEISNIPALAEAGKLVTLTASSIGVVSPLAAMLALTFFEERLKPLSQC